MAGGDALLPPIIARLYRRARFDLLRVHSLRYIGPAALIARRRYGLDVPIVSHLTTVDPTRQLRDRASSDPGLPSASSP
jgi:hypothetical protein